MAKFTTRVELLGNPPAETYNKLHQAMEQKKFSRSFTDGGKSFETPHAEYLYFQNATTIQVRDLAIQAAASVWRDFRVFVTSTDVRWEYYNLKQL